MKPPRTPITLLSRMSHELRTPLNAILGYAELVREELEEGGQYGLARDVDRIHRAAGELAVLVEKMLDLAELESGAARLAKEPFDVVALVREVVEQLRPMALRNGDRLELVAAPGALEKVGDAPRLRRVLFEIVENACRFTRDGRIDLHVEQVGARARIRVVDTGVGVAEAEQMRLFDAFYRAEEDGPMDGVGLGLAISRALCRLMGGEVTMVSQIGAGSTFTVQIPLDQA